LGDVHSHPPAYPEWRTFMRKNSFFNDTYEGLYDPVQQTIKTIPYIEKIYGPQIHKQLLKETRKAKALRKDTPGEAFSAQLVSSMRKTCMEKFQGCGFDMERPLDEHKLKIYQDFLGFNSSEAEEPENEDFNPEKPLQKPRQKGDDFFIMLERGVFKNPEFRKIFKGPFTVYAWLWSNIVREGWIDKKGYPIKKNYYDRGYLAYCSSYSKIGKECFLDKDTVKKYIDQLALNHIIRLEFIVPDGKKQKQGVYILGEWRDLGGQITEKLYLSHAFLEEKKGSPWDFETGEIFAEKRRNNLRYC